MRAVIYARYSSEQQREASIEDQVRLCRERLEREGWSLAATYTDHAASGATRLRPGYQKLLEDARARQFEVVLAEALDRLSRDQEDVAGLYKLLSFAGVKLVTLGEGEISELHVGLKGTMNALFLKDLADKTRRGLRGRVEAGRSGGGLCYGYDVVRQTGAAAGSSTGLRRINPAEAAVVRRIFAAYAAGRSPRAIAHALNREDVPGPRGQAWGPSTINGNAQRGTGLLNNALYVGRLVWNRQRFIKDPRTGKRQARPNPEDQWITKAVPALRIVDDELWQLVKARQHLATGSTKVAAPARQPFWARKRPRYLFSGLVKCGVCGGGYSKISANLFGCSTARNKGTCENRLNMRRDVLEASVLNGLRHHLMDPELFKLFAEEFYAEVNRLRSAEASKWEGAKAELARIEHKLQRLVQAIAEGAPARTLKDEMERLEARREELETLVADAKPAALLIHPNLAELYRRKVERLHEALASEDTQAEAAALLRGLIEAIVLTPEDGVLRLDLRGDLAGILRLAQNDKRPSQHTLEGLEQIKLVAGAGFEPATFRL